MPPNRESVGHALEDMALFTWILEVHTGEPISKLFSMYGDLHQSAINHAYKEAEYRWEGVWDKGWLAAKLHEWLMPIFLWWTRDTHEDAWAVDIRDLVPSKPS